MSDPIGIPSGWEEAAAFHASWATWDSLKKELRLGLRYNLGEFLLHISDEDIYDWRLFNA